MRVFLFAVIFGPGTLGVTLYRKGVVADAAHVREVRNQVEEMLEIVQLFAAACGVGDVLEQDDQFVVVARRVVDQAAAGAFAVRAFPGLLPEGAGGDVLECGDVFQGIYSHLAGRLSGMALRVDAQYPAGLLVDVRKQVVDRFARFVAQDVDAQVADRQVFDQLCEVAVIALRRLVTLIDGG